MANYIDHDHHYTLPRGGKVLAGDDSYHGEQVTIDTPEYSSLPMSAPYRSTGKLGVIQPCLKMDVSVGDQYKINANLFQRFQPILATPFTAIESSIHAFYVPSRMLDHGFEYYFTGGKDGSYNRKLLNIRFNGRAQDSLVATKALYPIYLSGTFTVGSTQVNAPNYFGKPLGGVGSLLADMNYGSVSIDYMPSDRYVPLSSRSVESPCNPQSLLAYHRIYNDYYRVPEIETDLFYHSHRASIENYSTSLRSFGQTSGSYTLLDYSSILLEWQHSDGAEGFLDFMVDILTNPSLSQLLTTYTSVKSLQWTYDSSNNYSLADSSSSVTCLTSTPDIDSAFGLSDVPHFYALTSGQTTSEPILILNDSSNHSISDFDLCFVAFCAIITSCRNAPWERDRFTSMLPYLERGEMAKLVDAIVASSPSVGNSLVKTHTISSFENGLGISEYPLFIYQTAGDIPLTTSITMDDIRQLNATAKFLEKNARVGYRFDEYVNGIFGIDVKGTDHMAKPSYIGGLKNYANLDIITSPSSTSGSLAAEQTSNMTLYSDDHVGNFNIPEPGIILAFLICKPRTDYINTLDRNNFKFADRTTLFTPDFQFLQEQPIFAPEINAFTLGGASQFEDVMSDAFNGTIDINNNINDYIDNFVGYERRYNEYINLLPHVGGELVTSQIYNSTARQSVLLSSPDTIQNDYYWQHVMFDDESVQRIFNYIGGISDQFSFNVGWSIEKLTLQAKNGTPRL